MGSIILFLVTLPPGLVEIESGPLSYYYPGDSCRTGKVLACDTPCRPRRYRKGSVHVAIRGARRKYGCATAVVVCSDETGRCVAAPVLDAGPWGIVKDGVRRVWRKSTTPPSGWKFRAVIDLSLEVWKRLGRPKPFSRVRIYR